MKFLLNSVEVKGDLGEGLPGKRTDKIYFWRKHGWAQSPVRALGGVEEAGPGAVPSSSWWWQTGTWPEDHISGRESLSWHLDLKAFLQTGSPLTVGIVFLHVGFLCLHVHVYTRVCVHLYVICLHVHTHIKWDSPT